MALHPMRGLLDLFGGQDDLHKKRIRAVGDPAKRFEEDALRIMRAFRFAAQLEFSLDEATQRAALEQCSSLEKLSSERINKELSLSLMSSHPSQIAPLILRGGLAPLGLPVPQRSLRVLDDIPENLALRLCILCMICEGKVARCCEQLKYSNEIRRLALAMEQELTSEIPKSKIEIKRRFISLTPEQYLLCLNARERYYGCQVQKQKEWVSEILDKNEAWNIAMLAINGEDLKTLGFHGPAIGQAAAKTTGIRLAQPIRQHTFDSAGTSTKDDLILPQKHHQTINTLIGRT